MATIAETAGKLAQQIYNGASAESIAAKINKLTYAGTTTTISVRIKLQILDEIENKLIEISDGEYITEAADNSGIMAILASLRGIIGGNA